MASRSLGTLDPGLEGKVSARPTRCSTSPMRALGMADRLRITPLSIPRRTLTGLRITALMFNRPPQKSPPRWAFCCSVDTRPLGAGLPFSRCVV